MQGGRSVSHSGKTLRWYSFRPVAVLAAAAAALLTTGLAVGPLAAAEAGAVTVPHATSHALATSGLAYTPLAAPVRIADTRAGAVDPSTYAGKTLADGGSLTVDVPSADIPANASAVVVNVTAITPSNFGFLTVFPGGGTQPGTANVTFAKGQTVGNLVTVGLGPDAGTGAAQSFTVFNGPAAGGGTADFTADLEGYYAPQTTTSGAAYVGLTPARIFDTRAGSGEPGAGSTLTNGGSVNIPVTGVGGVPASATAVVLNVALTNASAGGFITAYPTGQAEPGTASQNFLAGETLSSQVVAGVGNSGEVTIANHAGNVDIVADVSGYFTAAGGTGSLLTVLGTPARLTDTRPTGIAGGASATAAVQGAGATAGVLSIADITTPGDGNFLTAYPTAATAPLAATVNYTPGDTYNVVENSSYATTSSTGSVSILNGPGATPGPAAATANAVVDELGFFAPPPSNQTYTVTPATPQTPTISTVALPTQGNVSYTATGMGTTPVDIELFNTANETVANNQTTFQGTTTANNAAPSAGQIIVVNGTIQTTPGFLVSNVTPVNGQVTFTVNSAVIGAAVPVVFAKNAGNDSLLINASGAPTQNFGVGGTVTWSAAAAANGTYTGPITVLGVNPTANTFQASVGGGPNGAGNFTFNYNTPGSTYGYNATGSPFPINEAQFASYISAGDTLNAPLLYNSAGPTNTFTMLKDVPATPGSLTAAFSAAGTTAQPQPGVVLTWTLPPNPDVSTGGTIEIESALVTGGVVGAFNPVAGAGALAPNLTTFNDTSENGFPGSTFAYEILANGSGANGASPVSAPPVQVTIPTAAFTTLASAPVSLNEVLLPAGNTGDAAKGDIISIAFNQPLNTPTASATLTLQSGASIATLINGVNATFVLSGNSNQMLNVVLTGAPAFSSGSVLPYPANIIAASGVTGAVTSGGAGDLNWDLNTNTNSATPDGKNPAAAEGTATVPGNTGAPGEVENGPRALVGGSGSNTHATTLVTGAIGSALPGATVTVADTTVGPTDVASTVANANGSWSLNLPVATIAVTDTVTANEAILQEGAGETVPAAIAIVPT
jgi:hypothetical protein